MSQLHTSGLQNAVSWIWFSYPSPIQMHDPTYSDCNLSLTAGSDRLQMNSRQTSLAASLLFPSTVNVSMSIYSGAGCKI